MNSLSILDWYRILRLHHQWTVFPAMRYALWLAHLTASLQTGPFARRRRSQKNPVSQRRDCRTAASWSLVRVGGPRSIKHSNCFKGSADGAFLSGFTWGPIMVSRG